MRLDAYEKEVIGIAEEISFYLQKSGASKEDSQDVVQDVLLAILEGRFALPLVKLRPWMYRVAIRKYIDRYRREKTYHDILQRSFFHPEEVVAYDHEDYAFLHETVAQVKDSYRLVLDLYYFQGLSVNEISQICHLSQSKVKVDLYRGRKALKDLLKKKGYHDEDFNSL